MQRAIVTGATSQIGCFLLPKLVHAGFPVVALSRKDKPSWVPDQVNWMQADISVPDNPLKEIEPAPVLFHLAPLPLLPPLVQPLANLGLRRIIAFGSTSRYTKSISKSLVEQAVVKELILAESALQDTCEVCGISWTLFRPTLIYGCDKDKNVTFIKTFIERFGFFPIVGNGSGMRQPVHADDLAAACIAALDRETTYGRTYALSGGETLSYREMVQRIFIALGRTPRLVHLPVPLLRGLVAAAAVFPQFRFLTPDMVDRMEQDLCFDHSNAAEDFGYSPRPFIVDPESFGKT
jgi:nucleoside-diphosphate-sugar epimerase